MTIRTLDPDILIEEERSGYVRYRRLSTDRRWIVRGTCNQCGLCVIGAANPHHYEWHDEAGRPGAVRDVRVPLRLDEPVTPGFNEAMRRQAAITTTATVRGCSLSVGSYSAN